MQGWGEVEVEQERPDDRGRERRVKAAGERDDHDPGEVQHDVARQGEHAARLCQDQGECGQATCGEREPDGAP